ncbi:adenylyl-sulfate kinase [Pseudodesulfovibrio karagichevae]|uniref:Adenylyl-sulfate kinase n=1 Tax=Pseudodesulfovibrio karagichevae TaxID=3239305 RepID=A0ABV4K1X7_9BACT
MPSQRHICKYRGNLCRSDREKRNMFRATTLWFSGLSGAGKSTIAHKVEERLFDIGAQVYTFDGDNVRTGLCEDLSFSAEDRKESIRRICEMTKLFMDAGTICLASFITPTHEIQQQLMNAYGPGDFHLIHVDCPIEGCEARDVKGYYKLAKEGVIPNYTGVSSPYEAPLAPALRLRTDRETVEECVDKVVGFLLDKTRLE